MTDRRLLIIRRQGSSDHLSGLAVESGWKVTEATTLEEARRAFRDVEPCVGVILVDDLDWLKRHYNGLEDLMLSGRYLEWVGVIAPGLAATPACRSLVGRFFHDFHTLPVTASRLLDSLGHACGMAGMRRSLAMPNIEEANSNYEMLACSSAMERIQTQIARLAPSDAPVMITGESGTGKELAARAIHQWSGRASRPFVAVNCAALPQELIQSELFGHKKGAFTGAHKDRAGRIETAHTGTIFLDEIGDLPLESQVNLLRFLQEGTLEQLGALETKRVDVRVLAATNVDLQAAVREGRFREDLYYRLHVLHLEMPPLRDRPEDIDLLAHYYFRKFCQERRRHLRGFSRAALKVMAEHPWPGNVRELVNRVRRAIVMTENRLITPADLGLERRDRARNVITLAEARAQAERKAILNSLVRCQYNVSEAARQLGVSRVYLYRLMEKHSLTQNRERQTSSANA